MLRSIVCSANFPTQCFATSLRRDLQNGGWVQLYSVSRIDAFAGPCAFLQSGRSDVFPRERGRDIPGAQHDH